MHSDKSKNHVKPHWTSHWQQKPIQQTQLKDQNIHNNNNSQSDDIHYNEQPKTKHPYTIHFQNTQI